MKTKLSALLLSAFLSTIAVLPSTAWADLYVGSWLDNKGQRVDAYEDDQGDNWFIVYGKDGTIYVIGAGNPNPDGSGKTGPSSAADVANLLKKVRNAYAPKKNPEQTVIGKYMSRSGQGFAPRGNPGDTGYGDKGAPTPGGNSGPTKAELDRIRADKNAVNVNAKAGNNMNNDMSGGLGGGGEGPGFSTGGKGGKKGSSDGSSYTDGQNKTIGKTESLGPKPEVVNPPVMKK